MVLTGGGGAAGGFRGGGEGGDNRGEDNVGFLGGVNGCVQTPGAVVFDQRGGLPVVGVQTGAQRRLVVVAAADERLARHLRADTHEREETTGRPELSV